MMPNLKINQYNFTSTVWLYPGKAGWHFITLPTDVAEDIKHNFGYRRRGWGSIPIKASINKTSWKTSIFPDKDSASYLLPLKADVRTKEKIVEGKKVKFTIEIDI